MTNLSKNEAKKNKFQNGRLKKTEFFNQQQKLSQNFHRLVLSLVGLIDAKDINVT